jgi:methylisocitrate lyase
VLADADTGFGESEMVTRTVHEYARAGAAGMHIEDQVFPKRCGHLDGKALLPLDHAREKIAAAARASADCSGGSLLVCARTDARGVTGFDDAVARAREYAQAGADMIFPEGLASQDEFARFAAAMRGAGPAGRTPYLLANMTEFGKTPPIPAQAFAAMGYALVIYPVTLLRIAMGAVTGALEELRATGSAAGLLGRMQTRQELYALIGYEPGKEWDWGGPS